MLSEVNRPVNIVFLGVRVDDHVLVEGNILGHDSPMAVHRFVGIGLQQRLAGGLDEP